LNAAITLTPFIVYGIFEGAKREVSLGTWSAIDGLAAMQRASAWLNRPHRIDPNWKRVRVTRFEITGLT